jgi:uncharacterized Zn finger protein
MPSIADVVSSARLEAISDPETLALGRELADLVSVSHLGPRGVIASVEAAEVRLRLDGEGLEWSCTCRQSREGSFCEHCAATALAMRREALTRWP